VRQIEDRLAAVPKGKITHFKSMQKKLFLFPIWMGACVSVCPLEKVE
jgi:hypothetical protein